MSLDFLHEMLRRAVCMSALRLCLSIGGTAATLKTTEDK